MQNFTFLPIDKLARFMILPNMANFTTFKDNYELFLEAMIDLKGSMTPLDSTLSGIVLNLIYYIFMSLSIVSTYLGVGIIHISLILAASYYFYKKGIKSYNHIQDLDLPGYGEKRKDLINLTRRLRKIGKRLPPPFPNGWYCLVESLDLNAGDVKQVDCLGHSFAVFRTEDGKAHVTDAHCPHLGANLAVGGSVRGDCIECPFHKWKFNSATGKCVSIPNIETVPKGIGLKVWTCSETDGGIHVWYDVNGEPPKWDIPSVDQINKGDWVYHSRNEFLVASHIQDIPENGADVAHLNAIHADHLMAGKVLPTSEFWNILGLHEWNGKWEATEIPHEARVTLTHEIKLFGKFSLICLDVTARQIGPSYVHLVLKHQLGTVVIIQTVTPLEPLLQKVVHRFYGPWYIRPLANLMMWGETVMFHRDVMVWNSKEYLSNPLLAKTDRCIKIFRNWFQQFYSDNSTSFKESLLGPAKEVIDW